MIRKTFKQTLIDHVDKRGPDDCWEWTGATKQDGYGITVQTTKYGTGGSRKRKHWLAHRAYLVFIAKRKVPENSQVCHKCDNRLCCNPRHLVVADAKWNVRDMINKSRDRSVGERNPQSKLTDNRVSKIKLALKKRQVCRAEIVDRYKISGETLRKIVTGEGWKHVKPKGPIETLRANNRPSALSKKIRFHIRKHGMEKTAEKYMCTVKQLRDLAYPLAPGQKYR